MSDGEKVGRRGIEREGRKEGRTVGGRSRGRLTKRAVEREKERKRVVQFIAESTYQPLLHHSVTARLIDLYLMVSESGPEDNRNLHQCVRTRMYVYMYVRMYVCMHVCAYACMCVCMYMCMCICTYGCMYACIRTYLRMNAYTDARLQALQHCKNKIITQVDS